VEKILSLGEWLVQMEHVKSFAEMSEIEDGKLTLRPTTRMKKAWANAIKKFFAKHGLDCEVL
jgi:hypothetical protein